MTEIKETPMTRLGRLYALATTPPPSLLMVTKEGIKGDPRKGFEVLTKAVLRAKLSTERAEYVRALAYERGRLERGEVPE